MITITHRTRGMSSTSKNDAQKYRTVVLQLLQLYSATSCCWGFFVHLVSSPLLQWNEQMSDADTSTSTMASYPVLKCYLYDCEILKLYEDTLLCRLEQPGIKPPTFQLMGDFLSYEVALHRNCKEKLEQGIVQIFGELLLKQHRYHPDLLTFGGP